MSAETTRDAYRRVLLELAREDDRVFCVDSDVGGLEDTFAAELPEQYVNVGIAEATLVGVSAGLASMGRIPFANTMSAFATGRAAEQIKLDVAGTGLPVRIVGTHGGLSAGHYGPSHHALEDLAMLRALTGLTVIVPADVEETGRAVRAAAYHPGPVFIRLGRNATPTVHHDPYEFAIGRAVALAPGEDITIIATGPMPVVLALQAHEKLAADGIAARVLDMHTVTPADTDAILAAARQTAGIVTVEDHVAGGGLGGLVCETVCAGHPVPVRRIGAERSYVDVVGDEQELLAHTGITAERIVAAARLIYEEAG